MDVNSVQIISRIKRMLINSRATPEYIFNTKCSGSTMTLPEFKTLLKEFIERLADFEINFLFNKIDQSGRGKISKEMFVRWFG